MDHKAASDKDRPVKKKAPRRKKKVVREETGLLDLEGAEEWRDEEETAVPPVIKSADILSSGDAEAFNPDDKFEEAIIETKKMQYLYDMDDLYYFMDPETFEQVPLGKEQVEEAIKFMRPNDEATVKFFQGNAFLVEAPNFVDLEVIETEPGVKGNTATNVTKAATVETGAVVQVPIFIETGERIQIDTRTGEYLGRSK